MGVGTLEGRLEGDSEVGAEGWMRLGGAREAGGFRIGKQEGMNNSHIRLSWLSLEILCCIVSGELCVSYLK